MFKKIEIWILYLTIFFSLLFAVGFGTLVRQELVGQTKAGWVSRAALFLAEIPMNTKKLLINPIDEQTMEDRFPGQIGFSGNTNETEMYLLHSRVGGDQYDGLVELIDLRTFSILHTWNPNLEEFNSRVELKDEFKELANRKKDNTRTGLMHPNLTADGGLLFGWEAPLRKIDACSELIFQNTHDRFHHTIETDIDENIWASTHMYPQSIDKEKVGRGVFDNDEVAFFEDAIIKLSPDGEVLYEKSVGKILIENEMEYLLFSIGESLRAGAFVVDPIHLNDVQPVNFDGVYWKKGDLFISIRHQSMVFLYRPSTEEVIWKSTGKFFHQHDIDILDESRISIFNNNSKDFIDGNYVDGHNEVIIYDFKTNEYSSYLKESLIANDVRTVTEGRSQILPNGDLFIEESNYSRTLYFNSDGSLRWSHVNRAENGKVYQVGWSRILYTDDDIRKVKNFMKTKGDCND